METGVQHGTLEANNSLDHQNCMFTEENMSVDAQLSSEYAESMLIYCTMKHLYNILCNDRYRVVNRLQNSAALTILGLREKHKLTQLATQSIIEDTTSLMQVCSNNRFTLYCQLHISDSHESSVFKASGTTDAKF